jgi:DNA polymerase-3 subunit epsilon
MLDGQPRLEEVLPELARFAEGTVLVGHNVGFDLQFLRMQEERTGVTFRQPALDTLLLDAVVHPDHDDHSLEAVAGRLGVPVTGRHSALGDALVTGAVFLGLVPLLEAHGVHTLGEALTVSQSTLHARLDRRMYGG